MKTLAVVTVVFLPGTFVSAFFAIPMFEWDGNNVLSSRFWIWWAVVVPLTFAVVVPWIVWTRRSNTSYRRKQLEAKQKFEKAIKGLGEVTEPIKESKGIISATSSHIELSSLRSRGGPGSLPRGNMETV